MTVNELIEELIRYQEMGAGDDLVWLYITDSTGCGESHGATLRRVEQSGELHVIDLLDEETP